MHHTISSCPLIMYTADWISTASFQASPESTVHLLLHFSISPLDSAQIPVAAIVSLDLQADTAFKYETRAHRLRSL